MNTITIPCPSEVMARLNAEFPGCIFNSACFEAHSEGPRWSLTHYQNSNASFHASGATPYEAFADLRAQVATHDPLAAARKQLEAAGYTLTPPQQDGIPAAIVEMHI